MYAIRPQHVLSYHKFAERFCDARQTRFGWTDTGSSNADELFWLLKKEYMVRRLKRDVLTQLEPKVRYSVLLNVRSDMLRRLNEIRGEMKSLTNSREHMMRRKALVSEAYRETAKAKAEEVSKWVNDRIENTDEPFLVFAHHQVTLDTLERNLKIDNYMRIDGSVNKDKRQELVDEFQAGGVRVALLSIMAAGTGLTLTRASLAVFAELYWCPGQLLQAEDRVHRVGQQNSVSIIYLLGSGTVDTKIYPQVVHKLKVLDKAVDNRSDRSMNAISII
jgi:SWI/SNF-related matrix-associated actin-dependent regulator 1 of chromatin subfamily A